MAELAQLFIEPIPLTGLQRALMIVPICLAISIVYRTLKSENLREIPKSALSLCVTMVAGMWAVALGLWFCYLIFA